MPGWTAVREKIEIHPKFDILLAIDGEDSYEASLVLAKSLRRVPASQIGLTAPHLHRLHIGPARP